MANIFDKDTGSTDNHLLNEQFHTFSKSPSSPGSTLGGASNRSGHTVSASDVWAEKIPAFFYPKADSDYAVCKANAKLNDICRWGDEIQIWDGEKFVKFADNYAAIPDGYEFLNEDGQPVVRFHKSRIAYNLNDTNNAYDNSLDASGKGAAAKILGWDKTANDGAGGVYTYVESAPQFITQFVAPTDNIVKGVPSKGYGPIVMIGGSPLTEDADSTAGYIANNFAGIIQFNERKAQGTVTVHAFEYCGKTLGTTVSDIAELDEKLSKISVTASGGIQDASTDAKTAGFSVTTETKTNSEGKEETIPVFDIETGSVAANETKLVTGGAVKTYVDTTALGEGGSIAEYIKTYVATNAKVSVNGQSATTITVAGTAEGAADLVHIKVTEDKTTTDKIGLTLTATLDEAVLNEDGSIDKDGVVIATIAKDIAESVADTAINDAITTDNGAIKDAIDSAISDATLGEGEKIADTEDTSKLVTVEDVTTYVSENAKVTLTQGTGITVTPNGEASTAFTIAVDDTVATAQSVTDLTGRVTTAEGEIDALQTAVESLTTGDNSVASQIANTTLGATSTGSDNVTVILGGTVSAPTLTVTGTDIASAQALAALELTVTEHITNAGGKLEISVPEGGTLPTTGEAGKIYLIPNNGEEEQNIYDEFVWTNGKWEKIGSTKVDLTDYVTNSSLTTTLEGYVTTADKTTLEGQITAAQTAAQTAQTTAESKVAQTDYDTKVAELEDAISKAEPDNYITSINGSTGAQAITIKDGRETVYENDLWGTSVTTDGATITVDHKYLSNPNGDEAWLENVKAVQDNKAYSEITTDDEGNFTGVVESSVIANIQTGMIKFGNDMFYETSLASFSGDLDSLVDGTRMFRETSLASFNIDLSSLVNGSGMFQECTQLTLFTSDLSSLVNGSDMFYGCTNLTTINDDLISLVDGGSMFLGTALTSFYGDLRSLVDGSSMFSGTALTYFNSNLSNLTNGRSMFSGTSLKSFNEENGDLRSLVNGESMFYGCTKLTSFSGDLRNLVSGSQMFWQTALESFNGDLSSLVDGSSMFRSTALTSFTGDLSSLDDSTAMFVDCTKLTSFNGDLSSLLSGRYMFRSTALTSFNGDLSSLVNGTDMFNGAKLDTESVECIADTIRNVKNLSVSSEITGSYGNIYEVTKRIDIGIANTTPNEAENAAFWTMHIDKGWDVYIKGSLYNPTEPTAIATLDENGEEVSTPIPFWAKPVETDEEHAEYVGEDGKFYKVVGGQFIYVSDPETYGQFTSLADAVANMRLTKYEKPQEEA